MPFDALFYWSNFFIITILNFRKFKSYNNLRNKKSLINRIFLEIKLDKNLDVKAKEL